MSSESQAIEVTLPQMGESVTEGTILEWRKQVGDTIEADEVLVEVSTDKVDAEVPAPVTGTILELIGAEGDTIEIGAVLAKIAPGNATSANADAVDGTASAVPSDNGASANGASGDGEIVEIVAPAGGESVTEGTILEWAVKVGDTVADGDTVVELSTDKVDMELPSPAAGTITELLFEEGDTVQVGDVLARLKTGAGAAKPAASSDGPAGEAPVAASADGATPVAARAAAAEGVDISTVAGSGPRGRVTKDDVLAAANGTAPAGGAAQPTNTVLKGAAAMLARYMDDSREIPTATSFRTITVTTMDGRRKQLKDAGQKVSFTHLIAYAISLAAQREMPVMAHHFDTIDGKPTRVDDDAVNLGIAVDVEKKDGSRTLMVPVIRDAGRKTFSEFKASFDDLIARARDNALTADDLAGANVQLTNPGGIGTVASVPRLMKGNGTIIATGSIAYPVGLGNVGAQIGAEKVMSMTSTYDHRIIQGAESGRFLQTVEAYLQGEHGFYEEVFESLGAPLGATPQPPVASVPTAVAAAAGGPTSGGGTDELMLQAVQAATSLLKAHRTHGHLAADLDPLGSPPKGDPALDPDTLNLTDDQMRRIPSSILRMYVPGATLADALPHLRDTYCGTIAYEIEHLGSHRQRMWLREQIESGNFRKPLAADERKALLRRLIEVDAFERFMHKAYLGQKQFSIEGLDVTVPMLDELIQLSAANGAREVVVGMAHRGRLNVLAHNLGRPYETIFAEFEGASTLQAITTIPQGGTGDVKYHHGAQGSYQLPNGESILVNLESNPSHLEFVHPVVVGAARAAQTSRQGPIASRDTSAAVPIVLHGDAAFPGQGVVAEGLNMRALDGYTVGGTVHIVTNNQIGFTTNPRDSRSTRWASDIAKGYDVPIIHVNADDVEASISAVRLAFAFRQEFDTDVVIDLIGYRRFGHNEADEPAYTQPDMYARIKDHPRVAELWADYLVNEKLISEAEVEEQRDAIWNSLTELHHDLKDRIKAAEAAGSITQQTGEYQLDRSPSPDVTTAVDKERLLGLNTELLTVPEGFNVHPKLVKQLERRREAVGPDGGIDWAHAEQLAYASLLTEGIPVRLTGQDVERGTFSQRHLVLSDAKTGDRYCPIQHLPGALAPLELHNSPLSEQACLGFEYGYSAEAPETFVLWEAQFGDFSNGAQVMIDQFIVSGLAKWGQTTRLTMLLPHGYEGSGPEHSSARVERFLQLAAEGNIRVANLTTPAQYFHLLRRQARIQKQRPLVIFTPKSLLRLPTATSRVEHLADSRFFPVLGEPRVDTAAVKRLVLCTGKIYYDLVSHPKRQENPEVAVGRVELLYPFPEGQVRELIDSYPNLEQVLWVQEEPRNMGARAHMSPRLLQILPDHLDFGYVGRPERASPGEGYPVAHNDEQNRILETALDMHATVSMYPAKTPGQR